MADLDTFIASIPTISQADLTSWISDFAYQGINIEAILTTVIGLCAKTDRKTYLQKLVAIGLMRGNKVNKIAQSMSKEVGQEFRKMCSAFSIVESIKDSPSKPTALTLSRLRIVVPQVAAVCLKSALMERPVALSTLVMIAPRYPSVLRDMCMASLIVREAYNGFNVIFINSALKCLFCYCLMESKILRAKEPAKTSAMENALNIKQYLYSSFQSQHVSNKSREKFCNDNFGGDDSIEALAATAGYMINHCVKLGLSTEEMLKQDFVQG